LRHHVVKLFCSLSLRKVCEVRFRLGFDVRLGKQVHRLHHRDRLWVDNRAADVLYLDAMSHFDVVLSKSCRITARAPRRIKPYLLCTNLGV